MKSITMILVLVAVVLGACQQVVAQPASAAPSAADAKASALAVDEDLVQKALLPLPESLRDGASIVAFDADWNRQVLREGTNDLSCIAEAPFMGIQYAICQHISSEPYWVFGMQLRQQGVPGGDMNAARIAALSDGSLEIPVAGTARYFLVGGGDVLFPLLVISLPDATSESSGLSTEADAYRPWLMHAGTPGAHVMIHGK